MHENRSPDWNWVKATDECTVASMFSQLHELARRDIRARNEQLKREKFTVSDDGGGCFWVDHGAGEHGTHIWFSLLTDTEPEGILVKGQDAEVIYTVKLDDMGCCKLWSDGQSFDPWQVLKLALEPLLF